MNIVLCQPQIPPNTGNIARLCVATKTRLHLVRPLGFSTDDAQLKRAGLDYWQFLEIYYYDDWEHFLRSNPDASMYFFSKKAKHLYTQVGYQDSDFLVFGSETKGLSQEMLDRYSERLCTIPMWGPTRSLNLSTSVGIALYEALRQVHRGFSDFY